MNGFPQPKRTSSSFNGFIDNVKEKMFKWWSVTDRTIVASALDLSGSKKKFVILSNGWFVIAAIESGVGVVFEVSKDRGTSWSVLCRVNFASYNAVAMISTGTRVIAVSSYASGAFAWNFDATTIQMGTDMQTDTATYRTVLDSAQTASSGLDIDINQTGTAVTSAWSSKNATLPNSFNVRSVKGTIAANGTIAWTKQDGTAGVDQVSTINTATYDHTNPSVVYNDDGKPVIVCQGLEGGAYYIRCYRYTTTWSTAGSIHTGSSHAQSNPCIIRESASSPHPNRLWCFWQGRNATYNKDTLFGKYSDDRGSSWNNGNGATEVILGESNIHQSVSPTCDASGNVYVMFIRRDGSSIDQLAKIVFNGTSWGTVSMQTSQSGNQSFASSLYDPSFTILFSDPLTIWRDSTASAVKFRGTWRIKG